MVVDHMEKEFEPTTEHHLTTARGYVKSDLE